MSASSPEELETLLEDAVLMGDQTAVAGLFHQGGLLIAGLRSAGPERALDELARLEYVAGTTGTVWNDVAVFVGADTVNVSLRASDGAWRLIAAVLRTRA